MVESFKEDNIKMVKIEILAFYGDHIRSETLKSLVCVLSFSNII